MLAALAVDQSLHPGVGRIGLAHRDARAQRGRTIEILRQAEIEGAADLLARRANAPIGKHGNAPHILFELRGFQIDPALAKNDRDLAFVIEAVAAFRVDEFAAGADEFALHLPEAPKAAVADYLARIAL